MKLSPRERQVADLLLEAKSNKQIAMELGISPSTVETYMSHMRLKFKAANRAHLAVLIINDRKIK